MLRIENDAIYLRDVELTDLNSLCNVTRSNSLISNFFNFFETKESVYLFLMDLIAKNNEKIKTDYSFIVINKKDESIIGCLLLNICTAFERNGIVQLSIMTGDKVFLNDIFGIVNEFCFTTLHFHKIVFKVLSSNINKNYFKTLLKKNFYKKDGIERDGFLISDQWYNVENYSILIQEWQLIFQNTTKQ